MMRRYEMNELKPRIVELLKTLEKQTLNPIEKKISEDGDAHPLTVQFLGKCVETEKALAAEVESNRLESERLRAEIHELQQRLKDEPEAFGQSIPEGHTPSILDKVRDPFRTSFSPNGNLILWW